MKLPCTLLASLVLLGLASACASDRHSAQDAQAWSAELRQWGTLREALRDGRVEGRVALASVAERGTWGVGALEDLAGEVTFVDGEAWVSRGDAGAYRTTRGEPGDERATVLFVADVGAWQVVPVEEAVDPSVLGAWVAERAAEVGLDVGRPFPFVYEGPLTAPRAHVIAGACPLRARMLGGEPEPAPFVFEAPSAEGQLVGIHARDSHGVVCHAGSSVHVHANLEGEHGPLTAHVEWVGLAPGGVLKLPRAAAGAGAVPASTASSAR